MNLRTLEQDRAEYAYKFIETISGLKDLGRDELVQTITTAALPDFDNEEFYRDFIEVMGNQITPSDFGRKVEEKLSTLISKAPVMVLTNGLGQTMAFFASKAGGRPFELGTTIREFLREKNQFDTRAHELELKLKLKNVSEDEKRNAGRELKQLEIKVKKSANAVKSLLLSPSNTAHLLLYASIQEWLHRRKVVPKGEEFLEWFTTTDSLTLNHATKETLELLKWMKRFSDAMLEGGEGE